MIEQEAAEEALAAVLAAEEVEAEVETRLSAITRPWISGKIEAKEILR